MACEQTKLNVTVPSNLRQEQFARLLKWGLAIKQACLRGARTGKPKLRIWTAIYKS